MKKLFLATLLISAISSNFAQAKTEGSYAGVDILNTKITFYERYTNNTQPTLLSRKPSFTHSDYGVGAHYNYAVNMNGLFISPGLILELNNATAQGTGTQQLQRLQISNRYGAKLDLGVDITNSISPYVTGGYVALSHKSREYFNSYTNSRVRSGTSMDWFYGAGVKFDLDKYTSVNVEYNTQNFAVRNSTDGTTNQLASRYQTRLDVLKFGIAYRF